MTKKKYNSPIIVFNSDLQPNEDPTIIIGPSQGSSGIDTPYTFEGISEEDLDMIGLNCDDFDLDEMDSDNDYIITADEFDVWLKARGGW